MLISDEYRSLNAQMHEERKDYGSGQSSGRWMNEIVELALNAGAKSMLDYGCGKGHLAQAMGGHTEAMRLPPVRLYDPAVPAFSKTPDPADFVVCTDVLEHVEPACLKSVLKDLVRVTGKVGFFTVACRPAKKTLADGRNAHLIQWPAQQWLHEMLKHFHISQFIDMGEECIFIVRNKK